MRDAFFIGLGIALGQFVFELSIHLVRAWLKKRWLEKNRPRIEEEQRKFHNNLMRAFGMKPDLKPVEPPTPIRKDEEPSGTTI